MLINTTQQLLGQLQRFLPLKAPHSCFSPFLEQKLPKQCNFKAFTTTQ